MKQIYILILLFFVVQCKKEKLPNLSELLENPDLLIELEKRLGNIIEDDQLLLADSEESLEKPEVGCYALSGTLENDCHFNTNGSTIIKTTESLGRGAKFLEDFSNVSCARDCTALCCENEHCDTAVYRDKEDHSCYLFQCGESSACVFVHHSDYWMGTISKEVHKSHSYTPGGATHSHENELENLGSHDPDTTVPPTTTKRPTTTTEAPAPGLRQYCESYKTKCGDPHAECLMKTCRCRSGYHEKHGVCRKHCRDDEFECENIAYGPSVRQCVHSSYVCDGNQDCVDGSDEYNCPEKEDKPDDNLGPDRPPFADKPKVVDSPENLGKPVTARPPLTRKTTVVNKAIPLTEAATRRPTTQKPRPPPLQTDSDDTDQESEKSQTSDDIDLSSAAKDPDSGSNMEDSKAESVDADTDSTSGSKADGKAPKTGNSQYPPLKILNEETVVETYSDQSQGPIVALALGLAITLVMLIFVGCRLRNVKRRLRKGRALHSNEADYLINGMYL